MAKTQTTQSSVKIVDGKLILSLPDAKEPVVWQMDLDEAKSAAFTVKENAKTNTFSLVLKGQNGSSEEIAPFDDKKSATDILMKTSEALQNAHGKIRPQSEGYTGHSSFASKPEGEKGDKLGAILAMILAVLLILVWIVASSASHRVAGNNSLNNTSAQSAANNTNPRSSSGVPVSADDFLSNR
ncbi:MAG: hypothetical protein ACLFP8_08460 [Alphaproteobacteria bacterium]